MKRIFATLFLLFCCCCAFAGCGGGVDLNDYVSDRRSRIFIYADDGLEVKIYCVSREQPFCADGYRGEMCDLAEVYAKFDKNPQDVEVEIGQNGGEMSYNAVEGRYFLSYSCPPYDGDGVDLTLTYGGNRRNIRALSVSDNGVLSCESALACAAEHGAELFASLTARHEFKGEIYIRLLYDDGCYYYVGVCDRDKNITAYLLDGGIGKVIAEKKMKA